MVGEEVGFPWGIGAGCGMPAGRGGLDHGTRSAGIHACLYLPPLEWLGPGRKAPSLHLRHFTGNAPKIGF